MERFSSFFGTSVNKPFITTWFWISFIYFLKLNLSSKAAKTKSISMVPKVGLF